MRNPFRNRVFIYTRLIRCVEFFVCLLAGLAAAGCASSNVEIRQRPVTVEESHDSVYQAIRKELTDRGFQLDQVNRRRGLVETHALLSKQWFEFWRHDVVSGEASAEASLQTIRRRVRVTVRPTDSGHLQLDCQVPVERRVSDLRQESNQVQSRNVFYRAGGPVPSLAPRSPQKRSGREWQNIDHDELLEKAILTGILNELKVETES